MSWDIGPEDDLTPEEKEDNLRRAVDDVKEEFEGLKKAIATLLKVKEVSKFFGGSPRSETADGKTEKVLPLPTIQPPVLPSGLAKSPRRRGKEGC